MSVSPSRKINVKKRGFQELLVVRSHMSMKCASKLKRERLADQNQCLGGEDICLCDTEQGLKRNSLGLETGFFLYERVQSVSRTFLAATVRCNCCRCCDPPIMTGSRGERC